MLDSALDLGTLFPITEVGGNSRETVAPECFEAATSVQFRREQLPTAYYGQLYEEL